MRAQCFHVTKRAKMRQNSSSPTPLTVKQLQAYPPESYRQVIPDARLEGKAEVAKCRDGPFELYYKLYGHGPINIIWIAGHGAGLEDWYAVIQDFGVQNPNKYTSVIFENRGVGDSKAPWSFWSIKDLVEDTVDLLSHLQWNDDRSIHVVGHSMGGMIALELATKIPNKIASLTLVSTTSNWRRDISYGGIVKSILSAPLLLSADSRLSATKVQAFGRTWLNSPDETGVFPTNGDAWAARFLSYPVHVRAAILQSPAAARHRVSAPPLKALAEALGTGRVGIVHGTSDRTISVNAGRRLWEEFGGTETGARIVILDDVGHLPHVERRKAVIEMIDKVINGSSGTNVAEVDGQSESRVTVGRISAQMEQSTQVESREA